VFYWLRSHEHFIRRYYEVKVDLWAEAEQKKDADKRKTRDQIQAEMAKEESTTRASFNWRRYAVAATVFGSASLDFVAQRNAAARSYLLVVAGAMQLAATVLSVWLAARYGAQDPRLGALSGKPGRKFWKLSVAGAVYGLLILSCVVLLFVVQINKAQAPPPVWGP
jgi:hypothetical protein